MPSSIVSRLSAIKKNSAFLPAALLLCGCLSGAPDRTAAPKDPASRYPEHWWLPVPPEKAASWEVPSASRSTLSGSSWGNRRTPTAMGRAG